MNIKQKITLLLIAAVILLMFLFPPFHIGYQGGSLNKGYSFIFSPSDERATVNIGMLFTQWMGALILGGIAFLLLKDKESVDSGSQNKKTHKNTSSELDWVCDQCEAPVKEDDKYCARCGKDISYIVEDSSE